MKMKATVLLVLLFSIIDISCSQDKIYTSVDVMPTYPGGDSAMMKYLTSIKLPYQEKDEAIIRTQLTVRFVVTDQGKIEDVEVIRSLDRSSDSILIQAIKEMPDWKPGMQDGKRVNCYYTIPLRIHLRR